MSSDALFFFFFTYETKLAKIKRREKKKSATFSYGVQMLFVDHIHSNSTFLLVPELSVAGAQETPRICTMPFR